MAIAAQDGEDENYWPGFVDALTTMVMVLTFIMMLLGITVFSLSQSVSKALLLDIARSVNVVISPHEEAKDAVARILQAISAQAKDSDTSQRLAQMRDGLRQVEERSQREALLWLPGETKTSSKPAEMRPLQAGAVAGANDLALTIVFQQNAALFDEGVRREVHNFAERAREGDFLIRAYAVETNGTITESRRLAYYRAMMVRQEFVKAGLRSPQVNIQIEDSTDTANRSLVRVFALRKAP